DHQLALANDDHQEDPINTREHPVFLPTPPGADESQLLPILFEHRIISDPGPLPAATRGLTFAGGVTPQRDQHVQAQASEPFDPGALGQCADYAGWLVIVPSQHSA